MEIMNVVIIYPSSVASFPWNSNILSATLPSRPTPSSLQLQKKSHTRTKACYITTS